MMDPRIPKTDEERAEFQAARELVQDQKDFPLEFNPSFFEGVEDLFA